MVTKEDPIVQKISAEIEKEYGFIPILTIISIVISTIQLLWSCARPKSTHDARRMLSNNYSGGQYTRMPIIFTQREIMRTAKKQGVTISLQQASDISHKILDGLRKSDDDWKPDLNMI